MSDNITQFKISASPHIRDKASTGKIMLDVVVALLPTTMFGVYNFGLNALLIILVAVASSMFSELLWNLLMKKRNTLRNMSAVVTGLLFALNLPPTIPLWIVVIGAAFAIWIVKMLFGGLGQNFLNPALAAKCLLLICFSGQMGSFVYQGISSITPMNVLQAGGDVDILQLFLGNTSGCIGETSTLAILVGVIYLFIRRIIDFRIPLFFIIASIVYLGIYSLFTRGGVDGTYILTQLLGGSLILGAFFMATDYVTSPVSPKGRIIYGAVAGALTITFRLFGDDTGSVAYAIIIANMLTPLIDKITRRKSFGKGVDSK